MEPFQIIRSVATPLDKINVDTDQIIPKQFLKLVQKSGFGKYLFYDWRYEKGDIPRKDFILNDDFYKNSKILLVRDNFGCGSSREHAAWALYDYGFRVIISTSFADIFYNNCFKNGILPIKVSGEILQHLFSTKSQIEIDLKNQIIKTIDASFPFHVEPYWKKIMLEGLDDISITLQYQDKIKMYEFSHVDNF